LPYEKAGAIAAGTSAFRGGSDSKYSIRALKLGDRIARVGGARGPGKGLRCARSSSSVAPQVLYGRSQGVFPKVFSRHIVWGHRRRGSRISWRSRSQNTLYVPSR